MTKTETDQASEHPEYGTIAGARLRNVPDADWIPAEWVEDPWFSPVVALCQDVEHVRQIIAEEQAKFGEKIDARNAAAKRAGAVAAEAAIEAGDIIAERAERERMVTICEKQGEADLLQEAVDLASQNDEQIADCIRDDRRFRAVDHTHTRTETIETQDARSDMDIVAAPLHRMTHGSRDIADQCWRAVRDSALKSPATDESLLRQFRVETLAPAGHRRANIVHRPLAAVQYEVVWGDGHRRIASDYAAAARLSRQESAEAAEKMTVTKLERGVASQGNVRLMAIDMGFDPRTVNQKIALPAGDCLSVGYEDEDGNPYLAVGSRAEIATELRRCGYLIATESV